MPSFIGTVVIYTHARYMTALICTHALSLTAFTTAKIASDFIMEKNYPGNLDVLFQALFLNSIAFFCRYNV